MDAEEAPFPNSNARVNVFFACFILFLLGSINSLGVLSSAIEAAGTPAGQLKGVWTSALALIPLVSTPMMIFSGLVISGGKVPRGTDRLHFGESKTHRVRTLVVLGSLSYLSLFFVAFAVAISKSLWIRCGVAMLGIASGPLYVLSIEILAAWVPQNAGLAIGIGFTANGAGAIIFSALLGRSSEIFGYAYSLRLLALLLTLPTLMCSPQLTWPSPTLSRLSSVNQNDPKAQPKTSPLSFQELCSFPCFALYFLSVFTAQATYAFIPGFFEIGNALNVPMAILVSCFQISILSCTILRPLGGFLADNLKCGQGRFSLGSKNAMSVYLCAQAILFFSMISASSCGNIIVMQLAMGAMVILFSFSGTCVRILARDIFGPENSSLVFGVGGSLGLGLGEYFTMSLLSWVSVSDVGPGTSTSSMNLFYFICGIWSLLGLLSCAVIERCELRSPVSTSEEVGDLESTTVGEGPSLTYAHRTTETPGYGSILTELGNDNRYASMCPTETSSLSLSNDYIATTETFSVEDDFEVFSSKLPSVSIKVSC